MKRFMSSFYIIIFSFFVFILAACSSVPKNDYDSSFDFSKLVTYKIIKEVPQLPNGAQMPSLTFGLIKSAIDLEMAKKSYGKNDQLADFGITWHTALNDELYDNDELLPDWEASFKPGEEGMLIIDIVDLESNKSVWRGWEKNVLSSQNLEEKIKTSVENIFSSFPPNTIPGQ